MVYLHTDHLGSVSVATGASGQVLSQQEYDPWGRVRTGGIGITHTTLNYTGQRLDGTGLLYYHARYYDPNLVRFISPDSIVPKSLALTVDHHEPALLTALNTTNALTLYTDRWDLPGPEIPQLGRYIYARDNPVNNLDPNGHKSCNYKGCGGRVINGSDYPVKVFGTYRDGREKACQQRNQQIPEEGDSKEVAQCVNLNEEIAGKENSPPEWALQGWRTLPAHMSSVDLGMYDVDAVSAYDNQTKIDGYGIDSRFKLASNEDVYLTNAPFCPSYLACHHYGSDTKVAISNITADWDRSKLLAEMEGYNPDTPEGFIRTLRHYLGAVYGHPWYFGWAKCSSVDSSGRCANPIAPPH